MKVPDLIPDGSAFISFTIFFSFFSYHFMGGLKVNFEKFIVVIVGRTT